VVKNAVLFILTVVLLGTAFGQKIENPELRNQHAANSAQAKPHKSRSAATPVKSKSAGELAKIEQSGIKNVKPVRSSKPGHPMAQKTGTAAQSKNKSAKFSYHPPQAARKGRGNGARTTGSARPPKTLR